MNMLVLPRESASIASADLLHTCLDEAFAKTAVFTSVDESGFHSVLDLDELLENIEAALKDAGCQTERIGEVRT